MIPIRGVHDDLERPPSRLVVVASSRIDGVLVAAARKIANVKPCPLVRTQAGTERMVDHRFVKRAKVPLLRVWTEALSKIGHRLTQSLRKKRIPIGGWIGAESAIGRNEQVHALCHHDIANEGLSLRR